MPNREEDIEEDDSNTWKHHDKSLHKLPSLSLLGESEMEAGLTDDCILKCDGAFEKDHQEVDSDSKFTPRKRPNSSRRSKFKKQLRIYSSSSEDDGEKSISAAKETTFADFSSDDEMWTSLSTSEISTSKRDPVDQKQGGSNNADAISDYSYSVGIEHYVTPRRSTRQREKLRTRATFSLPSRFKELEKVSPKKEKRLKSPSLGKLRTHRAVNNFVKERSVYNTDTVAPESDFSESDDLEKFIVSDEDGENHSHKRQNKRKTQRKKVKNRSSIKNFTDDIGGSEDEIPIKCKKKKRLILASDEESVQLSSDQDNVDEASADELANEIKDLTKDCPTFSSVQGKRNISQRRKKINKKLKELKEKRTLSKLPQHEKVLKMKDLGTSSSSSEASYASENSLDEYRTDTENDIDDDFVVSDTDDFSWVDNMVHQNTGIVNMQVSFSADGKAVKDIGKRGDIVKANPDCHVNVSEMDQAETLYYLLSKCHHDTSEHVQDSPESHIDFIKSFVLTRPIQEITKHNFDKFIKQYVGKLDTEDSNKRTLVHIAAIFGIGEFILGLGKNDRSYNALDKFKMNPLMYSALFKQSICYDVLLKRTDLSVCHNQIHKHHGGKNLLHLIILSSDDTDVVRNSEEQIKCLNYTKSYSLKFYKKLLRKCDNSSLTPLMFAVKLGCYKVVKAIAEDSDVLNIKSEFGGNALHFAIQHINNCPPNDQAACLRLLLPKFLENVDEMDSNGFTPLMYAAEQGSVDCISALLEYNAKVMCKDDFGTTALHLAALSGSTACVELLLQHGHKVDCVDTNGWPPLLYANFQANESCVSALMNADPRQIFVLSGLLNRGDEFQRIKNRKVVESTIVSLANHDAYYTIFNDFLRSHPGVIEANDDGVFTTVWRSVLDFRNKVSWFKRRMEERGHTITSKSIEIDRGNVLGSVLMSIDTYTPISIRDMSVSFRNEPGICDGPKREFVTLLCKEIAEDSRRIFQKNSLGQCSLVPYSFFYQYSGTSSNKQRPYSVNKSETPREVMKKLSHLQTIGKVLASCIADGYYLNIAFTKSFLKQLLKLDIHHPEDLESLDPELYRSSVQYIMENDVDGLELSFSYTTENPLNGRLVEVNLKDHEGKTQGARNKIQDVTNMNKEEYLRSLSTFKIETCTERELTAFRNGFYQKIPPNILRLFTADDFSLLINGVQTIDISDWKANTKYANCSAGDNEIVWFWRTVSALKQDERALLLKFSTGSPCVPTGGFQNMTGLGFTLGFTVGVNRHIRNKIPTSSTCFNTITLCSYDSEKELRGKLLIAIRHGSEGFSFD